MVYNSKSFKASAWLLALSIAAGGTVSAQSVVPYDTASTANVVESSSAAVKTPFTDVKAGHWAEKHIAKLALQNIIVGNNGLFRPSDSVSRQEAIVMAIRFAGLEGELNRNETVVFPSSFKVDNYFVPYVVLAFEKGLIDQNEQFGIADQEAGTAWGSSKASREWVTKLIVNAIGKSAEAKAAANQPLTFADTAKVGEGYAGYIHTAVSLNLVNGLAGNKFDPKGVVNRAMMATLLSRAESQFPVQYEGQTEGILTFAGNGSIQLYTSNGVQTYATAANTLYSRIGSELFMAESELIYYARVLVIVKDGKAQYVEQVNDEQKVETISGSFINFNAATKKLYIWKDAPVEIAYDETLQVKDGNGNLISLNEVANNSKVSITRDTFRPSPMAIAVQVTEVPAQSVDKTDSGTVRTISSTSIIVNNGTSDETWDVAPDVFLTSGSTVLKTVQDIKPGDKINYVIKDNVVTRIDVVSGAVLLHDSGEYYKSDSGTLTYMKDKKYITKSITDATVVYIEGLPTATMSDLQQGDELDITVNETDQVTKVTVTNRKVEMAAGVEIRNYDADLKILLVVDGKGEPRTLKFTANSQIDNNGVPYTIESAINNGMLAKGRKVTLTYTGESIVKIQLAYRYTGTVVSINSSTAKITLSVNGSLLTLPIQTPSVNLYGKNNATLSDVQNGDEVTVYMNQEQDKVVNIQVSRKVQMKVTSVNLSNYRIALRDVNTNEVTEYSVYGTEMLNESGNKITLGSLAVGSAVNVVFSGTTPTSINRVAVTVGTVRAVDAAQVTLSDYKGGTTSIPLGESYKIVRDNVSSTVFSALQAGDRVELRKDVTNNVLITVLKSVQKKFWKFDAATNTLQTKRASINDENYKFPLSDVALTSNGNAITPQSLADGDKLVFYYYEDKLVEIEKIQ
ncbi:S-layer homology domain-containing protein [Paenibacillus xylaniclasticus]|uniref:S-layer homology domain-containing protein n=1 Tax=Paenibacillus xylaniclasticus TaxID=588083 RepID=UPI000FD71EBB|nr:MULTISPECIES: S-layer homology domain-containing protein [Paenibacillus]GFN30719.1 hypothetical protein PCURB6_09790 [Paenibacillus curdlanolyticus]